MTSNFQSSEPSSDGPLYSFQRQAKNSSRKGLCRICGDQARIVNYGVFSCQSCKTFFRRNASRTQPVRPCPFDRLCEVNLQTRHCCTACRLSKCLLMGMSADLIRKQQIQPSQRKSSLSKSARKNTAEAISTKSTTPSSTLTTPNQLSLIEPDWRLLSNIIHAYDTFTTDPQLQHFLASLPLSSFDHYDFLNLSQMFSHVQSSFQSFIGSSPDFRILTTSEQRSLFRRNLPGVIGFGSMYVLRQTADAQQNSLLLDLVARTYGSEFIATLTAIYQRFHLDSTLIKVFLLVLAFSSNCSMMIIDEHENNDFDCLLLGTYRLLGSQNVYVELLWKYLITRYGYSHAAQQFSRLIKVFLCVLQNFGSLHANNRMHRQLFSETDVRTGYFLRSHQDDQSLLWGRT